MAAHPQALGPAPTAFGAAAELPCRKPSLLRHLRSYRPLLQALHSAARRRRLHRSFCRFFFFAASSPAHLGSPAARVLAQVSHHFWRLACAALGVTRYLLFSPRQRAEHEVAAHPQALGPAPTALGAAAERLQQILAQAGRLVPAAFSLAFHKLAGLFPAAFPEHCRSLGRSLRCWALKCPRTVSSFRVFFFFLGSFRVFFFFATSLCLSVARTVSPWCCQPKRPAVEHMRCMCCTSMHPFSSFALCLRPQPLYRFMEQI